MALDQGLVNYSPQTKSSLQLYGLQSKDDLYTLKALLKHTIRRGICYRRVWPARPQMFTIWFWEFAPHSLDLPQIWKDESPSHCTSPQGDSSVYLSE